MQIVFPTFEVAPVNPGGAGVLISAAIHSLAAAGYQCTALCAFPAPEVAQANRAFGEWAKSGAARALELGALAPPPAQAFSAFEANTQQVAAALRALAHREPIAMVEFIDYTGLGAATLRARAAGEFPPGILLTVRIHGTLGAIDAAEGVALDEVRRRMHEQEAYALRNADRVFAPTEAVGADYAARYGIDPARIVVSPPPMKVLLEGLGPVTRLPDPLHFLFYGKLQEVKGCDIFARAAVALIREEPTLGWRLTMVGRDTLCTAHNRMASECVREVIPADCADRFELVSHIPRMLLPEIVRTVAAAVIPSRSESFCLAAHELRALGLPLIVPGRAPFLEYFHPEAGCLSFDGSAESLAVEMRRFTRDAALRRSLRQAPLPRYPPFERPYAELLDSGTERELAVPRERWLPCAVAALLGAALVLVTYQPGMLGSDALDQLGQAREHAYNDWHPVAMSVLWGGLDRIVAGPLLVLILQNLLFWGGLALVAAVSVGGWLGAVVVLVVGDWPSVFSYLGDVVKDAQMIAALMAALGLLALSRAVRPGLALTAGAVVCLLYASAVRHNGALVAAPLVFLLAPKTPRWAIAAIAAACFCVDPMMTRLVGANQGYPVQQIFLFDLAGLSIDEGTNLVPSAFEGPGPMTMARLNELYHDDDIELLAWPRTPGSHLLFTRPYEEVRWLPRLWLAAIVRHPADYLRHRWHLFLALLGLRTPHHFGPPFAEGIDDNPLGLHLSPSHWRGHVVHGLEQIQDSLFFQGWVYVLMALVALGVALWRRSEQRRLLVLVIVSSLANAVPYFWIGTTHHFRFMLWTVVVGPLSLLLAALSVNWSEAFAPRPGRPTRTARSLDGS